MSAAKTNVRACAISHKIINSSNLNRLITEHIKLFLIRIMANQNFQLLRHNLKGVVCFQNMCQSARSTATAASQGIVFSNFITQVNSCNISLDVYSSGSNDFSIAIYYTSKIINSVFLIIKNKTLIIVWFIDYICTFNSISICNDFLNMLFVFHYFSKRLCLTFFALFIQFSNSSRKNQILTEKFS